MTDIATAPAPVSTDEPIAITAGPSRAVCIGIDLSPAAMSTVLKGWGPQALDGLSKRRTFEVQQGIVHRDLPRFLAPLRLDREVPAATVDVICGLPIDKSLHVLKTADRFLPEYLKLFLSRSALLVSQGGLQHPANAEALFDRFNALLLDGTLAHVFDANQLQMIAQTVAFLKDEPFEGTPYERPEPTWYPANPDFYLADSAVDHKMKQWGAEVRRAIHLCTQDELSKGRTYTPCEVHTEPFGSDLSVPQSFLRLACSLSPAKCMLLLLQAETLLPFHITFRCLWQAAWNANAADGEKGFEVLVHRLRYLHGLGALQILFESFDFESIERVLDLTNEGPLALKNAPVLRSAHVIWHRVPRADGAIEVKAGDSSIAVVPPGEFQQDMLETILDKEKVPFPLDLSEDFVERKMDKWGFDVQIEVASRRAGEKAAGKTYMDATRFDGNLEREPGIDFPTAMVLFANALTPEQCLVLLSTAEKHMPNVTVDTLKQAHRCREDHPNDLVARYVMFRDHGVLDAVYAGGKLKAIAKTLGEIA